MRNRALPPPPTYKMCEVHKVVRHEFPLYCLILRSTYKLPCTFPLNPLLMVVSVGFCFSSNKNRLRWSCHSNLFIFRKETVLEKKDDYQTLISEKIRPGIQISFMLKLDFSVEEQSAWKRLRW